ncbi:MAG: VCBS repeat-containing protein [Saprospiraceae bacterium]|nr:VCBS repeat-containing protein [Saprospiraceae bacterium]
MKQFHTLLFLAVAFTAQAQITFSNQTTLLKDPTTFRSGVAVAIADMNADGLDDIVRLGNGSQLSVEYQALPNQPFANYTHGNVPGDAWAMVVGDVNNDGYNDILVGGAYDGVKVMANAGGSSFTPAYLTAGEQVFVQGSNFADINNDGWLDAFTCHDDGEPRIWGNDGTGTFILRDEWIDMSYNGSSDELAAGNYGSVWTDFDNDRDLDLYIAKCRQGVTNPAAPQRINKLYVNDGQNNFSEQGKLHGLDIGWQSWTADFQDIDNDGDMDCLVTNHDYPMQLLENDGTGHFTDIAPAAGVDVEGNFLQGLFRDFDNDGFVDIITVGNFSSSTIATHLFRNNGDKTFAAISNPFGTPSLGSIAIGDLNADGFLDLYAAYQTSFNNPNPGVTDRLWMNTTNNGNNYIAFDLHGTESNRMGVGARVEIHGSWGIQIREVRAGESYGIQNSLTQHFGIGTETEVEYVVVHWPSGKVDVVANPIINQKHTITEGETCSLPGFTLGNEAQVVLCAGQSVTVEAPAGYTYLWSNGLVSQSFTISEPGNYSVVVVDNQGCAVASNVLTALVEPDETPTVTAEGPLSFCEGESVVLTASQAFGYTWSNGDTTPSITVTESGDYTVMAQGFCGQFESTPIEVEVLPSPAPTASDVNLPSPGTATLEADGNNLFWYDSPNSTTALGTGATFITPMLTTTDTFYVQDVAIYNDWEFATGMGAHQGSLYSGNNFNGQTLFEVEVPLVIEQVTVYTDQPGEREIELWSEAGELLAEYPANLAAGQTDLPLNFLVPAAGQYRLMTDSTVNLASFGYKSPRLYRSDQGVIYPYEQPDFMSITGSNLGSGFYYYFYDWQIAVVPISCPSELVPVVVTVAPSGAGEAHSFGSMAVSPNPSSGLFTLEMEAMESGETRLTVTDLAGRVIQTQSFEAMAHVAQQRNIDLTAMPAGVYILKLTSGERSGYAKLVVE